MKALASKDTGSAMAWALKSQAKYRQDMQNESLFFLVPVYLSLSHTHTFYMSTYLSLSLLRSLSRALSLYCALSLSRTPTISLSVTLSLSYCSLSIRLVMTSLAQLIKESDYACKSRYPVQASALSLNEFSFMKL